MNTFYHKLLFVSFLFFSACISGFAQTIRCDSMIITAVPIEEDSLKDLKYQLHVKLYVDGKNNTQDTLKFKTSVVIDTIFCPRNIAVELLDNSGEAIKALNYAFNKRMQNQVITVNTSDLNDYNIRLSYDVIGSAYYFYIRQENHPIIFTFHTNFEGLFPMSGIQYDTIIIRNQIKEAKLFHSLENGYMDDKGLKLTLVDTTKVFYSENSVKGVGYTVYFIDSLAYQKYTTIERSFNEYLNNLIDSFPINKSFDIISAYWSNAKNNGYGMAFNNYILCDTSFLSENRLLLHESIHVLFPFYVDEKSKAKYFLGESTVEWVTRYLIDGRYSTNLKGYDFSEKSLYDIDINKADTWRYIYGKGVYILQQFADRTDAELLKQTILNFFIRFKGQKVCYDDFLEYFSLFFTREEIKNLDDSIKSVGNIN